jgi:hypothetical protein
MKKKKMKKVKDDYRGGIPTHCRSQTTHPIHSPQRPRTRMPLVRRTRQKRLTYAKAYINFLPRVKFFDILNQIPEWDNVMTRCKEIILKHFDKSSILDFQRAQTTLRTTVQNIGKKFQNLRTRRWLAGKYKPKCKSSYKREGEFCKKN